jgi:hypothetical protein
MSESERTRLLRKTSPGSITLTVGLIVVAISAEGLSFLNACVAVASCTGSAPTTELNEYVGLLVAGILVAVFGAVDLAIDLLSARARLPIS